MTINVFEYATRNKLRFATVKGEINVEQLWDVPLVSKDEFNLNVIAKGINKTLKDATEENFVTVAKDPVRVKTANALEVVKAVIAAKLADEELAKKKANARAEINQLTEVLARKQDEKLDKLTAEQIQKRIAALQEDL